MISATHSIRVRYADTDQMKYVYYGNYATFFEIGRVELFRSIGLSYKELENFGVMMPVLELNVKYHKPAFYDDLISITTKLPEKPTGVRIVFTYEIHNEKDELLTTGSTKLVFLNMHTNKPVKCPEIMLKKMDKYFT